LALFFRAEKGEFSFPLYYLGVSDSAKEPKEPENETPKENAVIKFDTMEALMENSTITQTALYRLGSFTADKIDHPHLFTTASLTPLGLGGIDKLYGRGHNFNFEVFYRRKHEQDQKSYSDASLLLKGTRIVVKNKVKTVSDNLDVGAVLPNIIEQVKKLMSNLVESKDNISKGVDIGRQALDYLNIHWRVEFGDSEIYFYDNKDIEHPRGVMKLSSGDRDVLSKAFQSLEEQLVGAKVKLVTAEVDNQELNSRMLALVDNHTKQKLKYEEELTQSKKNQAQLEQILITTKLSLAEAQAENERFKSAAKGTKKK